MPGKGVKVSSKTKTEKSEKKTEKKSKVEKVEKKSEKKTEKKSKTEKSEKASRTPSKCTATNIDNILRFFSNHVSKEVLKNAELQNLLPSTSEFKNDAVRTPLSEYQIFKKEHRDEVLSNNPDMDSKEVTAELKKMWEALPKKDKETYVSRKKTMIKEYLELFQKLGLKLSPDSIMNPETGKPVKRNTKKGIELQRSEKSEKVVSLSDSDSDNSEEESENEDDEDNTRREDELKRLEESDAESDVELSENEAVEVA